MLWIFSGSLFFSFFFNLAVIGRLKPLLLYAYIYTRVTHGEHPMDQSDAGHRDVTVSCVLRCVRQIRLDVLPKSRIGNGSGEGGVALDYSGIRIRAYKVTGRSSWFLFYWFYFITRPGNRWLTTSVTRTEFHQCHARTLAKRSLQGDVTEIDGRGWWAGGSVLRWI